jgi:hypothetical protein
MRAAPALPLFNYADIAKIARSAADKYAPGLARDALEAFAFHAEQKHRADADFVAAAFPASGIGGCDPENSDAPWITDELVAKVAEALFPDESRVRAPLALALDGLLGFAYEASVPKGHRALRRILQALDAASPRQGAGYAEFARRARSVAAEYKPESLAHEALAEFAQRLEQLGGRAARSARRPRRHGSGTVVAGDLVSIGEGSASILSAIRAGGVKAMAVVKDEGFWRVYLDSWIEPLAPEPAE